MSDDSNKGVPALESEARSVPTLSSAAESRIREVMNKYPSTKSAVMPALYIAQAELGFISPEAVAWVADRLSLPPSHVFEVASFYTMYYKRPVGKYHVQICRTLSCAICGAQALADYVKKRLRIGPQQVSANGIWSWEEVECLGSCGTAPMLEINDIYFENLTPETLGSLMDRIEKEQPDLRYSEVTGELGGGMPDAPRSRAWLPQKGTPKQG